MINTNELKVGNLVYVMDGTNYENYIWEVISADFDSALLRSKIGIANVMSEHIHPIPLTYEVLLNHTYTSNVSIQGQIDFMSILMLSQAKYLHELQNLYVIITKQELKVKC